MFVTLPHRTVAVAAWLLLLWQAGSRPPETAHGPCVAVLRPATSDWIVSNGAAIDGTGVTIALSRRPHTGRTLLVAAHQALAGYGATVAVLAIEHYPARCPGKQLAQRRQREVLFTDEVNDASQQRDVVRVIESVIRARIACRADQSGTLVFNQPPRRDVQRPCDGPDSLPTDLLSPTGHLARSVLPDELANIRRRITFPRLAHTSLVRQDRGAEPRMQPRAWLGSPNRRPRFDKPPTNRTPALPAGAATCTVYPWCSGTRSLPRANHPVYQAPLGGLNTIVCAPEGLGNMHKSRGFSAANTTGGPFEAARSGPRMS